MDKNTFLTDYTYNATFINVIGNSQNKSAYQVPNEWIIDAVNISNKAQYAWNVVDPSLDMGFTYGRKILKDTNNSTEDFEAKATPSLKQ